MTRRTTTRAAATLLLLTGVLAACGSAGSTGEDTDPDAAASSSPSPSESPGESPTADESATTYPGGSATVGVDPDAAAGIEVLTAALEDPADDRLADVRQGARFTGLDGEVSWRFPDGWESDGARQVTLEAPEGTWTIGVGARPGTTREADARRLDAEAGSAVSSTLTEAVVRDTDVSLVSQGSDTVAAQFVLWSPPSVDGTVAVILFGPPPLAEMSPERLEDLAQVVGSLEVDGEPV